MQNHSTHMAVFHFSAKDMRTKVREDGVALFCAKDACDILGIGNPSEAVKSLDEDEVDTLSTTDGVGRKKDMIFVTESGLYSLIFSSRKPEAKKFRKWVTSEVLPAIRRTGGFGNMTPNERRLLRGQRLYLIRTFVRAEDEFEQEALLDDLTDVSMSLGMKVPDLSKLGKKPKQSRLSLV